MKRLFLFCLLLASAVANGADDFAAEKKDDRLVITRGGRPVAHFVFKDGAILRPYFAHVHTPAGVPVTRTHPPVAGTDPVDHATMHPGIWLAFGDVSGQDFWRNKAAIRHEKFTQEPVVKEGALTFATLSSMVPADGHSLAEMACTFTFDAKHLATQMTWEAVFTPLQDGFYFGDQEEMGLGVRMATALSEKNGGRIESSNGKETAAATWGQTADWCDYAGNAGDRECGITLLTAPTNFRASWFHNRDYGLMVANPFGQKAMTKQGEPGRVPVAKGATLKLAFRVILRDESDMSVSVDSAERHRVFSAELVRDEKVAELRRLISLMQRAPGDPAPPTVEGKPLPKMEMNTWTDVVPSSTIAALYGAACRRLNELYPGSVKTWTWLDEILYPRVSTVVEFKTATGAVSLVVNAFNNNDNDCFFIRTEAGPFTRKGMKPLPSWELPEGHLRDD